MSNQETINQILNTARASLLAAFPDVAPVPTPTPDTIPAPTPDPVPAPMPVPSGSATAPTEVDSMTLSGGIYSTIPPFPSKNACLHFDIPGLGAGKKLHVEFDRAMTGIGNGNEKTYRMWNGSVGNKPDFYFGTPDGSWVFGFFEYVNNANLHISAHMPPMDGQFHRETIDFVFPSAPGKADGSIVYKVDGSIIAVATNVQMDDESAPAVWNWHCIQFDTPNWDPKNASMKIKADTIRFIVS